MIKSFRSSDKKPRENDHLMKNGQYESEKYQKARNIGNALPKGAVDQKMSLMG